MGLSEQVALLKRIDYLIRVGGTGTPVQLCQRLNISKTSLYRYLDLLRQQGAKIAYDRERGRFGYDEDFLLVF